MCVAIMAPKGRSVSADRLWRGWSANSDGGGFAYVDDKDQVVIKKGYSKYNDFHKDYVDAVKEFSTSSPFLIHMRIGTRGDKQSAANTHPFRIIPEEGPEGALIHNGTMFSPTGEWEGPVGDRKSDTRVLAERMGKLLAYDDVNDSVATLGFVLSERNKLALLYANRKYVLINERQGIWVDGIWYSNSSCNVISSNQNAKSWLDKID